MANHTPSDDEFFWASDDKASGHDQGQSAPSRPRRKNPMAERMLIALATARPEQSSSGHGEIGHGEQMDVDEEDLQAVRFLLAGEGQGTSVHARRRQLPGHTSEHYQETLAAIQSNSFGGDDFALDFDVGEQTRDGSRRQVTDLTSQQAQSRGSRRQMTDLLSQGEQTQSSRRQVTDLLSQGEQSRGSRRQLSDAISQQEQSRGSRSQAFVLTRQEERTQGSGSRLLSAVTGHQDETQGLRRRLSVVHRQQEESQGSKRRLSVVTSLQEQRQGSRRRLSSVVIGQHSYENAEGSNDRFPQSQLMSNVPRVIEVRSAGAQVTEWLASHEEDMEGKNEEHDIMWLPTGRDRWDKALGTGYFVVVKLVWQQALQNALSVANINADDWAGYAHQVLLSMQKDVLMAVAGGNLANLHWGQANKAVCDLFDENSAWMAQSRSFAPAIYIICLTDRQNAGVAHTPNELKTVIEALRQYGDFTSAEGREHTLTIDNAFEPRSTAEDVAMGRAHFTSKYGPKGRTRTLYKAHDIKTFCDALEERLAYLPASERDRPIHRPLQYIGRTMCFSLRKDRHLAGDKANWLMHLVHHISHVLWPGRFNLEMFPIAFQAHEIEVKCAEMLLTFVANSFAATSGGFNRAPPAVHGSAIVHSDVVLSEAYWDERYDFRESMGFVAENLATELPLMAECKAVNDQGKLYEPLAAEESEKDKELRELEANIARGKANLEKMRQDKRDEITALDEQIRQAMS